MSGRSKHGIYEAVYLPDQLGLMSLDDKAKLDALVDGGTDGQYFTMNNDGTGSWKTIT